MHIGEDDLSTNNSSDHVPVTGQIVVALPKPESWKRVKCKRQIIRWDTRLRQEYEDEVRRYITEIKINLSSSVNIDLTLYQFHSCLLTAARKCIPVTKIGHSKVKTKSPTIVAL